MTASAAESAFQQDIMRELVDGGWMVGNASTTPSWNPPTRTKTK